MCMALSSSLQGYHGDSVLVSGIGTGFAIVNVKLVDPVWKVRSSLIVFIITLF